MSIRLSDYDEARATAQEQANRTGLEVAILITRERGVKGYSVLGPGENLGRSRVTAEIVSPERKGRPCIPKS